jgi:hypothetical protein
MGGGGEKRHPPCRELINVAAKRQRCPSPHARLHGTPTGCVVYRRRHSSDETLCSFLDLFSFFFFLVCLLSFSLQTHSQTHSRCRLLPSFLLARKTQGV